MMQGKYYLLTLLFLCLVGCRPSQDKSIGLPQPPIAVFNSEIFHLNAGETQLKSPFTDKITGCEFTFAMIGLFGNVTLHCSKEMHLEIPQNASQLAGVYTLVAYEAENIVDRAILQIHAIERKGKILTYEGPKTVAFDDKAGAMLTSFFFDSLDNMIDTTLTISYEMQGKRGQATKPVEIRHNYFTAKVFPTYNNDKVLVGIAEQDAYSSENTIVGSSGCPVGCSIDIPQYYPIADGRQTFEVKISNVMDKEGYWAAQGTALTLLLSNRADSTTAKYEGLIINGSSTVVIQNPKIAGNYSLQVYACQNLIGSTSNIVFKGSTQSIPTRWEDQNHLVIGPIVGHLNQILPNGTPVVIGLDNCTDFSFPPLELYDGMSHLYITKIITNCQIEALTIQIGSRIQKLNMTPHDSTK